MATDEYELDPQELRRIEQLLASPDVWAEPSPGMENSVLLAIQAEAGHTPGVDSRPGSLPAGRPASVGPPEATVASIDSARSKRRWGSHLISGLAGAAAAAVLVVGSLTILQAEDTPLDTKVAALSGTENAPNASASATVETLGDGVRIWLSIDELDPAPEGTFYQAWVVRTEGEAKTKVAAGTFHLRSGDGPIELWSGVPTDEYNQITVTIQTEADPQAPGVLVLSGPIVDE